MTLDGMCLFNPNENSILTPQRPVPWTEQGKIMREERAVVSHDRPSCAVFVQIPLMLRI